MMTECPSNDFGHSNPWGRTRGWAEGLEVTQLSGKLPQRMSMRKAVRRGGHLPSPRGWQQPSLGIRGLPSAAQCVWLSRVGPLLSSGGCLGAPLPCQGTQQAKSEGSSRRSAGQ